MDEEQAAPDPRLRPPVPLDLNPKLDLDPERLKPSQRVRLRLKLLGWSMRTLGAARAQREKRATPYRESTVRAWLKALDEGRLDEPTKIAIAGALGLNKTFYDTRDPLLIVKAPTRWFRRPPVEDFSHKPEEIVENKLKRSMADIEWPRDVSRNMKSDLRMRLRLRTAANLRGLKDRDLARMVGLSRRGMWKSVDRMDRTFGKPSKARGARQFQSYGTDLRVMHVLCKTLNLPVTIFQYMALDPWRNILDPSQPGYIDRGLIERLPKARTYRDLSLIVGGQDVPDEVVYTAEQRWSISYFERVNQRMKTLGLSYTDLGVLIAGVIYANHKIDDARAREFVKDARTDKLKQRQLAAALLLEDVEDPFGDSPTATRNRAKAPGRDVLKLTLYRLRQFFPRRKRDFLDIDLNPGFPVTGLHTYPDWWSRGYYNFIAKPELAYRAYDHKAYEKVVEAELRVTPIAARYPTWPIWQVRPPDEPQDRASAG